MSNRILTEELITRERETVAPFITISWNPIDNSGHATFHMKDMITENGTYKGLVNHTRLRPTGGGMEGELRVQLADVIASSVTIQGNQYPGVLLMGMIKAYFEQIFSERLSAQELADGTNVEDPEETPDP